jgi:hypothetical protein
VAAVLTGTAAVIGSRGQVEGPMQLEAPGSQAQCSFCNLEARKERLPKRESRADPM